MDAAVVLFGAVVTVVPLYLIAWPVFRPAAEAPGEEDESGTLAQAKDSVFTTLGELEFDHHMKKLSDEDYQALQQTYRRQAVALLKAEEAEEAARAGAAAGEREADLRREIEAEIEAELAAEVSRSPQESRD